MQSLWSPENYITAYWFAARAHGDQPVPGTKISYLMHISFVCMEIMTALTLEPGHNGDLATQCALLHDVIEDTGITYDQVEATFGKSVADGVLALSKNKHIAKSQQMAECLGRIRLQPAEVGMVKLADRITNLQPPPVDWPLEKIKRYRAEAFEIYSALKDTSPVLASRLAMKIEDYAAFER
jgi:(p)ppGpp synthase/HD superfamily hydrolase